MEKERAEAEEYAAAATAAAAAAARAVRVIPYAVTPGCESLSRTNKDKESGERKKKV